MSVRESLCRSGASPADSAGGAVALPRARCRDCSYVAVQVVQGGVAHTARLLTYRSFLLRPRGHTLVLGESELGCNSTSWPRRTPHPGLKRITCIGPQACRLLAVLRGFRNTVHGVTFFFEGEGGHSWSNAISPQWRGNRFKFQLTLAPNFSKKEDTLLDVFHGRDTHNLHTRL